MPESTDGLARAFLRAATEQLHEGLRKIEHCVQQLTPDQVWWRPSESMNSIANLLLHLSGNVRQWLHAGLSEQADSRVRQQEFDDRSRRDPGELLADLRQAVGQACRTIQHLPPDDLLRVRHIQEFDVNAPQAILDSVSHFQGHVQEIVHLTRLQLGDGYRFDFIPR